MKTLSLEKYVDCDCDSRLAIPVVTYNPLSETRVKGCMGCGKVECFISRGDEPRGAGPVNGNNFLVALPEDWYAWLGQWPRLLGHPQEPCWVAADFRVRDWDELSALRKSGKEQLTLPPGKRLLRFSCPKTPPPPLGTDLARDLRFYIELWDAQRDGDVEKLDRHLRKTCVCE
jgi:hypothetical protein